MSTHRPEITGLSFSSDVPGLIDASAVADAGTDPNTSIRLGAISMILNEQKDVATGTSGLLAYTIALRVTLNSFVLGDSLLSGEIIVGHSEAAISGYAGAASAVPEPATWGLLILGFGLVGAAMRRRGRARPAIA